MKSIRDVLQLSQKHLTEKQIPAPRRRIEELLCHVLDLPRVELYMQHDRPLHEDELQQCRAGLRRLASREPWQHIVGEVEFFDCNILVTPDVLIPRQETEWIVEKLCNSILESKLGAPVLWDVCTGSGCIALAVKKKIPHVRVIAGDISPTALAIARKNAERNQLEIEWVEGDLLAPFDGEVDFIVSNPPYITTNECRELEPEVAQYEPHLALCGGEDGLGFYRRLAEGVSKLSKLPRSLWLELGTGQGNEVNQIFSEYGMVNTTIYRDFSGHQRLFFLESL